MLRLLTLLAATIIFTAASNIKTYDIGDTIAPFSVKSVSGEMVSLKDYSAEKGLILIHRLIVNGLRNSMVNMHPKDILYWQ